MVARIDRLLATLTVEPSGCWRTTRKPDKQGYIRWGKKIDGKRRSIGLHRAFYNKLRGPIPAGLEPDHTCKNRWCANPWHMEAVTHKVNSLRSSSFVATNALKDRCLRGHEFDSRKPGRRGCRECRRIVMRAWYAANRERVLAKHRERYISLPEVRRRAAERRSKSRSRARAALLAIEHADAEPRPQAKEAK